MEYEIKGSIVPAVECILKKGEKMYTQTGGMVWMSEQIHYTSDVKGGILNGIGRKVRGESLFLTTYESKIDDGMITFGSSVPGSVKEVYINHGQDFICQKTSFLCAQPSVQSKICFTKRLAAGLFGGEGIILQRLYGEGVAFLEISGDVCTIDLGANDAILVDSGCLVGFESSVDFDIRMVKGIKNVMFGGEGLFLSRLQGPGLIYLQTQNIKEFASKLQANMNLFSSKE